MTTSPGSSNERTPEQQGRIHDAIARVGIKGEFAKTAKRLLKATPEYGEAKREGRAREWLQQEASSFAESAFELLQRRCEEPDSNPRRKEHV
jgi:hypothetical protein